MATATSAATPRRKLGREDVMAGMTLMQTVYTVALVVGLQSVIDASYKMFFPPPAGASVRSTEYLSLVLAAIVLLAVRFFWVPRNLNSFIFHCYDRLGDGVFTRITTRHFPIVLAHALVIYYICQVFVDMTRTQAGFESAEMSDNVTRFTSLYAGLLLLNAVWLSLLMPRGVAARGPGRIWSMNNYIFVSLALVLIALAHSLDLSNSIFVAVACAIFIANSLIDLWRASKYYILYED